jgi:DNA-binding transcriptional ArsR family regulator
MPTAATPLLPLFRTDAQARLLAELYLRPQRQRTLSDLARSLGLSHTTVSREADRLERAGLVRSDRVGKQRQLRPDEQSPYFAALHELLLRAFGPLPLLERALQGQPGIDQAFLFGSWAARYRGEPGEPPNDLDLLVVGTPERRLLAKLTRQLGIELVTEVNPTVVPAADWQAKRSGFLRSLAAAPLVELNLDGR